PLPRSNHFPYTTLFRSGEGGRNNTCKKTRAARRRQPLPDALRGQEAPTLFTGAAAQPLLDALVGPEHRSFGAADLGADVGGCKADRKSTRLNSSHGSIS